MKKAIVVVVILLAAVVLGLPQVLGGMTESSFRMHIERMDENPMFALRVGEYQRGWFTSATQVDIAFDERYSEMILAGAAGGDIDEAEMAAMLREQSITVPVEIAHGPVILMDGLYFGLSRIYAVLDERDDFAAMAMTEFGLDYLAELRGQVSYFGTFSFTSNVPPIEYIDEAGELSFSGLNLDGSARGADLQLDGGMDRLSIDSAGTTVTLEQAFVASDASRVNHFLWEGEFAGGIENVSIVDTLAGAGGAISLTGLRATGTADIDPDGELLEGTASYTAESISIPAEQINVVDAELAVAIENVSVQALTSYYESALNMNPQNPGATMAVMQSALTDLLTHNPAISFDPIRFTLDGESLTAAISLRTVNGGQGNFDFANPFMLLSMFEASASLTAAKPLLERLAGDATAAQLGTMDPAQLPPGQDAESVAQAQASLTIALLVGQGYLIDDGENYTTDVVYSSGEVRVNGTPLPLGALLQ